ncbi:MAG: rod shape-determining protein RodA [Bdellovibrionales bacterium CG10_big_fil_rev_8_21_14_0_10_45_34]|nr:MAG: rod shape-determining protein RodA [Bdellovibrionales bacterium CG10_big_fil_rev_8_21_14_0_10_45_34]
MEIQVERRTLFKRLDQNLILVILALHLVGLINLFSATHSAGSIDIDRTFLNQCIWVALGWTSFFVMTFVDYQTISRLSIPFYIFNIASLAYVSAFGHISLGAQRWINFGFFKFQPSETAKLSIIFILSTILARKSQPNGLDFKDLLVPIGVTILPFALTVTQPDLGTAMMLALIAGSLIYFVKVRLRVLVTVVALISVTLPIAWNFALRDYQKNRVLTFLDPGRDPRGAGYNSIQSRIAVGSGRVLGKGFRQGTQSQLEFLPERHTDFIYSVLSEEHGFVGSLTTVVLFILLLVLALRIATQAKNKLGTLLAVGTAAMVFWHFCINIGMVIGILPIVGIPLPLLSYGGSSMLSTMTALGILSNISLKKYLF